LIVIVYSLIMIAGPACLQWAFGVGNGRSALIQNRMVYLDIKYTAYEKTIITGPAALCLTTSDAWAQRVKSGDVPAPVKLALMSKYPAAKGVSWEKEKGIMKPTGRKSGEDNSVQFTPDGPLWKR